MHQVLLTVILALVVVPVVGADADQARDRAEARAVQRQQEQDQKITDLRLSQTANLTRVESTQVLLAEELVVTHRWQATTFGLLDRMLTVMERTSPTAKLEDLGAGVAENSTRIGTVGLAVESLRRELHGTRKAQTVPGRRRDRHRAKSLPASGGNLIQLPSAESMRAIAGIARKVVASGGFKIDGDSRGDNQAERNGWERRGPAGNNA